MKRLLGLIAMTGLVTMVMAFGAIEKVFDTTYKIDKASNLGKAACTVCHMSMKGGKLNPYGKDLQAIMKAEKATKMTPALLAKVEQLDSDKDGVKNIDEIKKDTLPGVATN
jgi:hypothetical protein